MRITPTMIYENEKAYAFLVSYYLDKLSDPYYERELEQAENQWLYICENMASWIPYDEHAEKILQKIEKFISPPQRISVYMYVREKATEIKKERDI